MSKEINLLPLPRRRQLARRFFENSLLRLSTSVFLGLLLMTVVGGAALIVLTVSSAVLFPEVGKDLEQAVLDYRAETRRVGESNTLIKEMQAQHETRVVWAGYLPDVLRALPAGTQLQELSGDWQSKRLTIAGQAVARSALIVLEDKLRTLPWAKGVEAPVSNLLERVSPQFRFIVQL
ncbi:MAG: hypothetical protein AAB538_02220 [Patescibacteria group bacterium]